MPTASLAIVFATEIDYKLFSALFQKMHISESLEDKEIFIIYFTKLFFTSINKSYRV